MARSNAEAAQLFALGVLLVCLAAVVDPKFRQFCMGLLCRLG